MMAVTPAVWRVADGRRGAGSSRASCGTIRLRARRSFRAARRSTTTTTLEVRPLAKTPRTWTGARTPSGLKRVRQAQSRHEVLQPRRSAAKTYVAKALTAAAQPADVDDRSRGRPGRGAQRARPRRQGRRDPPERRRPPQVAPDPQGQRRARWRARPDRRPRRQDDRQGRRGQGRQGPHRGRQGRQGQGRPDRRRQGPRRAEQDRPSRGCRRQGRRRGERHGRAAEAKPAKAAAPKAADQGRAPTKASATKAAAEEGRDDREGRSQGDGQGRAEGQEGRDQGVARRASRRTTDAPGVPGAFRFDRSRAARAADGPRARAGDGRAGTVRPPARRRPSGRKTP